MHIQQQKQPSNIEVLLYLWSHMILFREIIQKCLSGTFGTHCGASLKLYHVIQIHHLHRNNKMPGLSPSRSEPHNAPDMAELLTIMENLRQRNESLQESVHTLQQMQSIREEEEEEEGLLDPQPLSETI